MIWMVHDAGSGETTHVCFDFNAAENLRAAGATVRPLDNSKFVLFAVVPGNVSTGNPVPEYAGVSAADLPVAKPVSSGTVVSGGATSA